MCSRTQTTEVLLRWKYVRQGVGRALYTLEQFTISEAKSWLLHCALCSHNPQSRLCNNLLISWPELLGQLTVQTVYSITHSLFHSRLKTACLFDVFPTNLMTTMIIQPFLIRTLFGYRLRIPKYRMLHTHWSKQSQKYCWINCCSVHYNLLHTGPVSK